MVPVMLTPTVSSRLGKKRLRSIRQTEGSEPHGKKEKTVFSFVNTQHDSIEFHVQITWNQVNYLACDIIE